MAAASFRFLARCDLFGAEGRDQRPRSPLVRVPARGAGDQATASSFCKSSARRRSAVTEALAGEWVAGWKEYTQEIRSSSRCDVSGVGSRPDTAETFSGVDSGWLDFSSRWRNQRTTWLEPSAIGCLSVQCSENQ